MKKQYGWVSEYKRKKFLERQNLKKNPECFDDADYSFLPKIISVMLDLDGTCDFIDDEKAKILLGQIEKLRKKFAAKKSIISISTHYSDIKRMQEVLAILSRNLSDSIKIGISFFSNGTYNYNTGEEIIYGSDFNLDKVKTFDSYYVNGMGFKNVWFAIIDDGIMDDVYRRYKDNHPMLVCRPSQEYEEDLVNNNFMNISTMTKGIDGVIEILSLYIDSIKYLSPGQIMEAQRNMITHLSSSDLKEKVREHDYTFLEKYFRGNFADEDDYKDLLKWLMYDDSNRNPSKNQLEYLREIFKIMISHFQTINEEENVEKIKKLEKEFKVRN